MLFSQFAIFFILLVMANQLPHEDQILLAVFALSLAFFSATQDIAIDAYRAEILAERERGLGVGLAVAAYRVALIAAGAGALLIAHTYGFRGAYYAMAALVFVGVLASYFGPSTKHETPASSLRTSLLEPLALFCHRERWWLLLAVIVSYKLGDALAERMTVTFLIREMELSLAEIGTYYKTVGIAAAVLGGVLGGLLMVKVRLYRALVFFALLQMLTNIGFVVLSMSGPSLAGVLIVVIAENLFGGMGTAAFVALLMALCDKSYTATQFALFTAIASLGRIFSGPLAGSLVARWDWTVFFICSVMLGLIPIIILPAIRRQLGDTAHEF